MSGEILRAVLDENCTVSRWKVYSLFFNNIPIGATRIQNIQCDEASQFLGMKIVAPSTFASGGTAGLNIPVSIRLRILTSDQEFQKGQEISSDFATSHLQAYDLAEYIYLQENQYLEVTVTNFGGLAIADLYFDLSGIEYRKL